MHDMWSNGPPKRNWKKPSHPSQNFDPERQGIILYLQQVKGARYRGPNGKCGILREEGIETENGTILYHEMTTEQLKEVTRCNSQFIDTSGTKQVTEDWSIADIKKRIALKQDPIIVKKSKILYEIAFGKPYPDDPPITKTLVDFDEVPF